MPEPSSSRRAVPDHHQRDLFIALVAGAAMMVFVLYAFVYFSRQVNSTAMCDGVIIRKTFVSRPETQITFGQGGLDRRQRAGEYSFVVRVPQENGREYTVTVDHGFYDARKEGDHLLFKKHVPDTP